MTKVQGKKIISKVNPKIDKGIPIPPEKIAPAIKQDINPAKFEKKPPPTETELLYRRIDHLEETVKKLHEMNSALEKNVKKIAEVAGVGL